MKKANKIVIDPVTRLEGEAKITILLDDHGNVKNAYFQTVEFRGFERFCVGRPVDEMIRIAPRICGVCPGAHFLAATKAADAVYSAKVPKTARKIRDLYYDAFFVRDHLLHFYVLASPDFVLGPEAPKNIRNVFGVVKKLGPGFGKKLLQTMKYMAWVEELIGGKSIHAVAFLPGGVARGVEPEERKRIEAAFREAVSFVNEGLAAIERLMLKPYGDMIFSDAYYHRTHYLGLVDSNGAVSLTEGMFRAVSPTGSEVAKFAPSNYLEHIAEHVEPWTFIKFPYLRPIGWKGLIDGNDSGIYRVGPLARMNVANGFSTEKAMEWYERFYEFFGAKPVHHTLAMHWARLIETLYAAEHGLALAQDTTICGKDLMGEVHQPPREGVGAVEAPRGSLIHHYVTDDRGILQKLNLVVATTHNNGGICMSVKKAAETLIKGGNVAEGVLNRIEMAFRAYDPCLACATHSLPGRMPMDVAIYDSEGRLVKRLKRSV